jgi:hypothetical protein
MKTLLSLSLALICSTSVFAQIPELTDQPASILGNPPECDKVDLVLDATNTSKYYRFGLIHNSAVNNWGQLGHQYITLGPSDMPNNSTPLGRNLYGMYAEMNTDKAFFGLKYRLPEGGEGGIGSINGDCYNYDFHNQSDALIAWGNDVDNFNALADRLIFEFHHFSFAPREVATMEASGEVGIHTPTPTAFLHVNCVTNNPDDGSAGSDVRFERLERGKGNILVIDGDGYVYDSGIPLNAAGTPTGATESSMAALYAIEKERNDMLEKKLDELSRRLDQVTGIKAMDGASGSTLFQNTPNPTNGQTEIEFNVQGMQKGALISVCDVNGREVLRHQISTNGKGKFSIDRGQLASGSYVYALIVDGVKADAKRMVVAQ